MRATISALWFLQSRSLVNLMRVRLKRLRQPRYLIGAVVGLGYLWTVFFRRMIFAAASGPSAEPDPADVLLSQTLASAGLAAYVLSNWLFAGDRAALTFTEAELAFLMPAPVGRTALLHYRLLRAQPALLFSTLFFNLVAGRGSGFSGWLFHGFTLWIVFTLLLLHSLGASFAIQRFTERGLSGWRRRLAVLAVAGGLVGIVAVWVLNAPAAQAVRDFQGLKEAVVALASAGPGPWILAPFRWVIAPWFARDLGSFALAALPALGVVGLHYLWVRNSEVAFEEASIEASRKIAERVAAVRSGNPTALRSPKARRDPFPLAPVGSAPAAFLWKNLILAGPLMRRRNALPAVGLVAGVAAVSLAWGGSNPRLDLGLQVTGIIAVCLLGMSLLLGPQGARYDFRADTGRLEVLKSLPVAAWQIVLGQILAPVVMITAFQWLLIGLALGAVLGLPELQGTHIVRHGWAFGLAAALLAPAMNGLLLLMPNAVAILLPGWSGAGGVGRTPGSGGVEMMGQRLLFGLGLMLALVVGLLPGAIVGGGCWWLAQLAVGPFVAIPIATLPVVAILLAEVAGGIWLLARAFTALDVAEG